MLRLVMAFTLLLSACAHNPYLFKETVLESGETKTHLLKYGGYCGDGHPVMQDEWEKAQRKAFLLNGPRPVDDLDAACYAHDMCFEQTKNDHDACDVALRTLTLDAQRGLIGGKEGKCWNLVALLTGAFLVKTWSKGDNSLENAGNFILGVGALPFMAVASVPYWFSQLEGYPNVGECNFKDGPSAQRVIQGFEATYKQRELRSNRVFSEVQIPTPTSWSNTNVQIQ